MVKNPQFVDQVSKVCCKGDHIVVNSEAISSRVRSLHTSVDLPNTLEEMPRTPQEELGKDQDVHRLRMKKLKAANFHLTMVKYKVQRLEKEARLKERNKRKARAAQQSMKLEDKEEPTRNTPKEKFLFLEYLCGLDFVKIDSKPKAILRDRRTRTEDFKLDRLIMRRLIERYVMHLKAIHFNAAYYDFLTYLVSSDYEHLLDDKDGLVKKLEEIHQAPVLPDYGISLALNTYVNMCSMFVGFDKEEKKIRQLRMLDDWKRGAKDSINQGFLVREVTDTKGDLEQKQGISTGDLEH